MNFGKYELGKLVVKGQDYFLVLSRQLIEGMIYWSLYVTQGPWNMPGANIVADPGYPIQNVGEDLQKDPYEVVKKNMDALNKSLQSYFGPVPVPVTWADKVDDACSKLIFYMNGEIPQVK